ncbi:MAG: SusC/RagA family TonB-linked outer membrane protein [Balneolaceae bacterium]|nr:MAG: SusC/RagA family TonB-linked outer membrane protein [Balneolaceae bacterium]
MKYATTYKLAHFMAGILIAGFLLPLKAYSQEQASDTSVSDMITYYSVKEYSTTIPELTNTISLNLFNVTVSEALLQIAGKADLEIAFENAKLQDQGTINLRNNRISVADALAEVLKGTGYESVITLNRQLLLKKEESVEPFEELFQEVTGRVTDATTREPLIGVTILVQGTNVGTTTDMDGVFSLNIPDGGTTLLISYIGYVSQQIPIGDQTNFEIQLAQDIAMLDDLVVVGYGVQRRSEITGSVGIVTADQINPTSFNALQGLRGRVAGVQIFQNSGAPSGSNRVIIRGTGTINASTDPLYIVDGVAMEGGLGGGINFLNPADIQSIEVLKDASATAIYGARGANGVILITTSRGGTGDALTVSYDSNFSLGRMRGHMDIMNAEEFMQVQRIGLQNVPLWRGGEAPTLNTGLDPDLFDGAGNPLYDTDWQREATRTAFSQDHNLSIQGGTDRSSLGAVLNLTNREGIFLNNYMNRYSLKVTYDVQPREWLRMGTNVTFARIDENHMEEGGGGQDVRRTIIEMAPILPITWPAGSDRAGQYTNSTQVNALSLEGQANPVHRLLEEDRLRERNNLFGNTFIAVQISPNLEFRTQLGINNQRYEERRYRPSNLIASGGAPDGRANFNTNEVFYWQNENFLTYTQDFSRSRVTAVLGASWQERRFRSFGQEVFGFADDFFRFNNFGAATGVQSPGSNAFEWTLNSYFNRITYSLDDTYVFTFTSRVDGSSRFGADNKYGFFPSAGFAWNLSNEDFMSNFDFIDLMRLRTSYGVTGNTEIAVFTSLATIGSGTTLIGNSRQSTSFTTRLPNPNLEWEKTYQFNIGTDVNLFNQAVDLEFDYYYKFTKDLLLNRPVPATTGFTTIIDNIGAVSNRGVDMRITTRNVRTRDFFWSTTLNFNYNKNRVERLGAGGEDIFPGPNWVSGSQTILRVGEPVGNFYGFIREGTWSTAEAEEAAARGFLPGEAKRSLDRTIIGNGLPDWTGSFINTINIKNFDFLIDLQFVLGADIMQQFLHTAEDRQALTNGLSTQLYNAWTVDNQDTMYQRIRHQPLAGQNTQADSHWIVDGSYIRGNLLQVGYNVDPGTLQRLGLNQLRITASLENAFVIHSSAFKGHDPEATSWGGNIHAQNIFFYQYPRPRTASLGVRLQF